MLVGQAGLRKPASTCIERVPVEGADSREWDLHVIAGGGFLVACLDIGVGGIKEEDIGSLESCLT